MTRGKILKVKYGYNPNSSSIGSETTGTIAELMKNAGPIKYSLAADIRYMLGATIAAFVIFFITKKLYLTIMSNAKKETKKK